MNNIIAISTAADAPMTAPILLVGDISSNLMAASRLGYQAIEIHLRENEVIDYEKELGICKQHNIQVATIVTGRLAVQEGVSLTDVSMKKAEIAVNGVMKYIDIAEKFGADIIIGWIRGVIKDSKKEYEKILAERIKPIEVYAKQKGVKVVVEAINRYEINSMNTGADVVDWANQYGLDNTYVHLDTFHMNIEEEDIAKTIEYCGEKLGYVHFADSNRHYPGAGHIDFKKVMEALNRVQYQGVISIECLPLPDRESAASFAIKNVQEMMGNIK